MDEQTVKCTRPDCNTDIQLIRENLVVLRPEVPLLSAKCPECGKTRVLTKDISKELVELYSFLYIGYLLLDEAEKDSHKVFIANRYIINSAANARRNADAIKDALFSDLLHADEILI